MAGEVGSSLNSVVEVSRMGSEHFPQPDPLQMLRERRLFGRVEAGDPQAREDAVVRYLPLAHHIAGKYDGGGRESLEDLRQVACLGLLKAVDRFNLSKGCAFTSFAVPTISGEIMRHFRDRTWTVRTPRPLQNSARRVEKAVRAREQFQQNCSPQDVADELGITENEVVEAMQVLLNSARNPGSLDKPIRRGHVFQDSNTTVGDAIPDPRAEGAYARVVQRADLLAAIADLPPRLKLVITAILEGWTQAQIGEQLGVSQMQISRDYHQAIQTLTAVLNTEEEPPEAPKDMQDSASPHNRA